MRRRLTAFSACVLFISMGISPRAQETDLERQLRLSMTLDHNSQQRLTSSAKGIRPYIRSGYVSRRPELRMDYTDYRVVRRPAKFFEHYIVVIEEEYMEQWIGCCVSPGIGLVLERGGDEQGLRMFAESNGCSLDETPDVTFELRELGLSAEGRSFLQLSCRERDINR